MYTMSEVCRQLGLKYETLKFYCNQGLVPNVKRDHNQHHLFDGNDLNCLRDLLCLKRCGMTIAEIKNYLHLCLLGAQSIPEWQAILKHKRTQLLAQQATIAANLAYIQHKQSLYHQIQTGKIPYRSNLLRAPDVGMIPDQNNKPH